MGQYPLLDIRVPCVADNFEAHRGPRQPAEEDLELLGEMFLVWIDISQHDRRGMLALEATHRVEHDLPLGVNLIAEHVVLAGEPGDRVIAEPLCGLEGGALETAA